LTAEANSNDITAVGLIGCLLGGLYNSLPPGFWTLFGPIRSRFVDRIPSSGGGLDLARGRIEQNCLWHLMFLMQMTI
jgi:hypothetical protein